MTDYKNNSINTTMHFFMVMSMLVVCAFFGGAVTHAYAAWQEIPNSKMQLKCMDNFSFANRCNNIIDAWGGGALDAVHNRLFLFGGGHGDSPDNSVYALDLNTQTWQRLTDLSPGWDKYFNLACPDPADAKLDDGAPIARHSYGGLAYIEHANVLWMYGGSMACGSGGFGKDTWTFNPTSKVWTNMFPTGPHPGQSLVLTAYDKQTRKVFVRTPSDLYTYDYDANVWERLATDNIAGFTWFYSMTLDPVRRKLVLVGGRDTPHTYLISLDGNPNYNLTPLSTSNGQSIEGTQAPGVAFDPTTNNIIAWDGSKRNSNLSTVWSLNPETGQWTLKASTGTSMVTNPSSTGTYGRWQYVPQLNKFVGVADVDQNAWLYQISGTGNPTDTSPPSVTLSQPSNGATLSGNTTLTASATDNVGVIAVTFQVNGSNVGSEMTTFPYSLAWNTTSLPDGSYTLTATARDAAGNTAQSSPVTVTVANGSSSTPPPSPGQIDIPLNTWVPVPLDGDWHKQPVGEMKHMRLAHNPVDGKIYFVGGDHQGQPGWSDSGRNEMYTYEIATNTWEMIQPYCDGTANPKPARLDEVGWVYDTKRNGFWATLGWQWGSGETSDVCPQPNGYFRQKGVMFYDPVAKTWEHGNRTGIASVNLSVADHKVAQYDPVTDRIIVLGTEAVATYDIANDVWSKVKYSFNPPMRLAPHYPAIDVEGRVIYGIDKDNPRLFRYNIDSQTMDILGPLPIMPYIQAQAVWNSVSKVLEWFDHQSGQLNIYHPDTNTWDVDVPAQKPSNIIVQGNHAVFDPYQNVHMIMGGTNIVGHGANPYVFLYRYGPGGTGSPLDTTPPGSPKNLILQQVN